MKKEKLPVPETPLTKFVKGWVVPFLIAAGLFLFVNIFCGFARIYGESMFPTFDEGNTVFIFKQAYLVSSPQHDDLVIFATSIGSGEDSSVPFNDGKKLIKRVMGIAGDRIVVKNGEVFRNDVKLDEPYIAEGVTNGDIDIIVPEGHVFVMGDNRLHSLDSRFSVVGPIPIDSIVGKVVVRVWPLF